jgi:hypothetical protein
MCRKESGGASAPVPGSHPPLPAIRTLKRPGLETAGKAAVRFTFHPRHPPPATRPRPRPAPRRYRTPGRGHPRPRRSAAVPPGIRPPPRRGAAGVPPEAGLAGMVVDRRRMVTCMIPEAPWAKPGEPQRRRETPEATLRGPAGIPGNPDVAERPRRRRRRAGRRAGLRHPQVRILPVRHTPRNRKTRTASDGAGRV